MTLSSLAKYIKNIICIETIDFITLYVRLQCSPKTTTSQNLYPLKIILLAIWMAYIRGVIKCIKDKSI